MYLYRFKGVKAVWPGIPCRDLTDQEYESLANTRKNVENFYQYQPDPEVQPATEEGTPECIPCQAKKKTRKTIPVAPPTLEVENEPGVVVVDEEVTE